MTKAIITTLDNLPILERQIAILREDSEVAEIIVVNNGSIDGTRQWLDAHGEGLTVVHRENRGAGPGRNAGLDAAGSYDFVLMLDGGILPLPGSAARMRAYLDERPDADVLGLEIGHMVTDESLAAHAWPGPIASLHTYRNSALSHTGYCLARASAFQGLRFSEEGPFGEPGWGVDDDEMACQWIEAGIVVHVVTGVPVFRRASGSFQRLFDATGIWPNQYGSVYEQRLVLCLQRWPQHKSWGEPWLTVIVRADDDVAATARLVKRTHDRLRQRRFDPPYQDVPNPYSVVLWTQPDSAVARWAEPRRLRQHHGDTVIIDGAIVRRGADDETWTGDFRVEYGHDYHAMVRPRAHYYGVVTTIAQLETLADQFDAVHPPGHGRPKVRRGEIVG